MWIFCEAIKKVIKELKDKGEYDPEMTMENHIVKILSNVEKKPVSLEVISTKEKDMRREAKILYDRFKEYGDVVIKIPINPSLDNKEGKYDGLKVIKELSKENKEKIPMNCTIVMTPEQALLAAKAGAKYVSLFAGRIDDYLRGKNEMGFKKGDYYAAEGKGIDDNGIVSGVDLVSKTVQIFKNYNLETEIIAASLRNARQVREIALAGAHIATIPFSVLEEILYHKKTEEGVKKFAEDVVPEYRGIFKISRR